MSWYPAHHDEDVIGGVTVGATGATATSGPTGPTGSSSQGAQGPTGPSGAPQDVLQTYYPGSGGNRPSGGNIQNQEMVNSQVGDVVAAPRLRGTTRDAISYDCLETGIYRVAITVAIARDSATANRSSMLKVTWGRWASLFGGDPTSNPLMEWYGGAIDVDGHEQIDGIWVGTLTVGNKYGLYQQAAGEGSIEYATSQNSNLVIEWVRAS